MQPGSEAACPGYWAAIAEAFKVRSSWLSDPQRLHIQHHCLGLWNSQDEGLYRHVFLQVRHTEGARWLTNDRTPAQLLRWWIECKHP
ncbi:hypothetical protein [Comamonas sp. GB3 AK4-5]|uniref:hypothetical protein n=1 Tax=Comamonas sp. GB3 AK4-5 TaxID=3231487 RepID=UPI00351E4A25